MKPRHVEAERTNAREVLGSINASAEQDFHTLSAAQIDLLLVEANRVRYQKPPGANGSRARYFYQLLQRRSR